FEEALRRETAGWREQLDRVTLELPADGADLAATVRANLGYILVNRDGPAIQPGSRAYDRSWIRDGALTSAALIRLGHGDAAASFAEWFAGYQFASGRVPCCVDGRGADPVPEHDSHGELVYLIAEVVRSSGDLEFARRMWPHVAAATDAIDALRAERRTVAEEAPARLRFWGLLPESISHEGYSDRPVHSYWDDCWGIRGLEDGAWLANRLGLADDAARLGAAAAEMRREVVASMTRVMAEEGVEYLPASADLADFDPTSTTVAVAPLGLQPWLPARALETTFWRYLAESRQRAAGTRQWDAYTPYELRTVGTLVRLGWRDAAWEMLRFFLADRRPAGWRQWAEVVGREPRAPRFLGDMPHTWCGSDFIRSALDLLAWEDGDRLVLAAGVPAEWTNPGERVVVSGLVTRFGPLSYRMASEPDRVVVTIDAVRETPPGGVLVKAPGLTAATNVTVNGRVAAVVDGGVAVTELPAVVVIGR
ncbi:MAG: coagulation factor 5/8 type domain-containing protein, partial [Holophagae bacterium]